MSDQAKIFGILIAHARYWAQCRMRYRRLLDSRRATDVDREKAKKEVLAAAAKLERAIRNFDKEMRLIGGLQARRKSPPLDFAQIAGVVAKVAGGLETALKPQASRVIDVDGFEVNSK